MTWTLFCSRQRTTSWCVHSLGITVAVIIRGNETHPPAPSLWEGEFVGCTLVASGRYAHVEGWGHAAICGVA